MKENWTYKKLGEVCRTTSGGTPSKDHKEYYEGGTIPWLRSGEVSNRNITETELFITQYGVDNSSAKLVPKDSVVVAMYGATVGQVGILRIQTTTNQAVCSVLPNDSFMPEFLYYALMSNKKSFLEQAVGGAQPNISQQIIKNTIIPILSITEQATIVSELDLLQSIIDKQQAQLKELDKLAQSVFYDMFGDPVENEKGWEVNRLGDVCELKAGKSIKASELSNSPAKGLFPCYGGNGIRGFIAKKTHNKTYPIIGRQGALCGNVNMAQAPFYATEHAVVVTPSIELDVKWLYFQLKAMRLNQYAHGVAQPGLAVQDLTPLSMIVPPINLQQSFAAKIESIEKQKSTISQSIAETQKLFNYTMDKYFG